LPPLEISIAHLVNCRKKEREREADREIKD